MMESEDWTSARKHLGVGTMVSGRVVIVKPFGVFVKLEQSPVALLLVPYIMPKRRRTAEEGFPKVGEIISARISVINDAARTIGLTQLEVDT